MQACTLARTHARAPKQTHTYAHTQFLIFDVLLTAESINFVCVLHSFTSHERQMQLSPSLARSPILCRFKRESVRERETEMAEPPLLALLVCRPLVRSLLQTPLPTLTFESHARTHTHPNARARALSLTHTGGVPSWRHSLSRV